MLSSGGTANAATAARHGSGRCSPGRPGARWARRAWPARTPSASTWAAPPATCRWCSATAAVGQGARGRASARQQVDVHTVGAGGGSIAWRDAAARCASDRGSAGGRPRVRPATAAAARSRRSPTRTCCSATSNPDSPLAGGVRLDRGAAEHAVARLAGELGLDIEEAAAGIARGGQQRDGRRGAVMTVERGSIRASWR